MINIINIGFDKDDSADFSISGTITQLNYNQMNELRAMVVVAIGRAEEMWRESRERNYPVKLNPQKEEDEK